MGENQKKILQMLADGKITVDEATRLLSLVGENTGSAGDTDKATPSPKAPPKYLYVRVEPKEGRAQDDARGHRAERVNVRVPVSLIRAGMKLTALMPPQAAEEVNRALKEKGMPFDIRNLKDDYVEQLIDALSDTEIDVDSDSATVKVYAQ